LRRVLVLLLVLLGGCHREKPRYNLLLITLDTTRADHLGCYGGKVRTPAIDAIANTGVRFDQADSAAPLTLPSHATILSGLLPLHHGLRNNAAGSFPTSRETLATVFSRDGYATAAFVSSFVVDHRFGLNRGFDTYDDAVDRDSTSILDSERRGGATADAAIAWLNAKHHPFFAWVHFYDPHAPYAPPEPYRGYDGEIAYVDAQISRLTSAIDRTNTVIVIAGDHGEGLGDHGEQHHGLLAYESTLHVPLIIAAPQIKPFVVSTPVSTADIARTVASLAGAQFESGDGADLSAALQHGLEPPAHEIYAETQYPVTFGWTPLRVLRQGRTKLIEGRDAGLFALPDETTNIAANERRTFSSLSLRLAELKKGEVDTAAVPIDAETKAKLASLGYVAPAPPLPAAERADPRAMRDLFRKFEDATTAMSSGHAQEAKTLAGELVVADPRNRVFRSTLARACRVTGDTSRALALYREAVALAPADGDAWYDLASALHETGATKETRAAIEEAVRLEPDNAEALNLKGTISAESGDATGAIASFQRAVSIDQRNARAWTNIGNASQALGRNQDASAAFLRAAALDPRDPDPINGMGVLLVQEGRASEALAYFDRALAIAPDFGEARLNRAVALINLGETAKARQELRGLLQTPQRSAASELLRRLH